MRKSIIACAALALAACGRNEPAVPPQPAQDVTVTAEEAIEGAVPLAPPVDTKPLLAQLGSPDTNLVFAALDELVEVDGGSEELQRALIKLLDSGPLHVREAVLEAAYSLEDKSLLVPVLERCLNDPSETFRDDAADVLGDVGTVEMVDVLVRNLTNEHEDVRDNCEFYLQAGIDVAITNTPDWFGWWASNRATFIMED